MPIPSRLPFDKALVLCMFLAVGVIGIGVGSYCALDSYLFVRQSKVVQGTIVGLAKQSVYRNHAIIEYLTPLGEARTTVSAFSSRFNTVGNTVEVLVGPGAQPEARVSSFAELWLVSSLLLFFGAGFGFIGVREVHKLLAKR